MPLIKPKLGVSKGLIIVRMIYQQLSTTEERERNEEVRVIRFPTACLFPRHAPAFEGHAEGTKPLHRNELANEPAISIARPRCRAIETGQGCSASN